MLPKYVSVGNLAAANNSLIAGSQTPANGAALTLTGSQPDQPRRVVVVAGSEAATRTLLLTGTGWEGMLQSETITITASTAGDYLSALDYRSITSIVNTSGAGFTTNVTVGTFAGGSLASGTGPAQSSAWVSLDPWQLPMTGLQINVNGTANLTVQQTEDDPNQSANPNYLVTPPLPYQMIWINHPDSNLVAFTASVQGNYAYPALFVKLNLNTYTAGAGNNATLEVTQSGGPFQANA